MQIYLMQLGQSAQHTSFNFPFARLNSDNIIFVTI